MTETWTLPEIDIAMCSRCGRCVDGCPEDAVSLTSAGPVFTQPQACTYCGMCEDLCPEGAISLFYTISWSGNSER